MDWRNPDYPSIAQSRIDALAEIRADPDCLPAMVAYYRDHPADFVIDWGVTVDPRNVELGRPAVIPFILFPRQVEWIEWVIESWKAQRPGVTPKSRESGMSWLAVALSCTLCLFNENMVIGFGSRKVSLVDKLGDPNSLFWKAREFMSGLPPEFTNGWSRSDAPEFRIKFPATNSFITGEGGDDIGRGGRTAIYFVDEAQPLNAKIMTPNGWREMADMAVGLEITGRDGGSQTVIGINDCGVHDIYRLTFSDGTNVECSPNHLWTVERFWGKHETVTLRTCEIASDIAYRSPGGQIQYRYRIPICAPVKFSVGARLPLDPYLVGALLGDGGISGGTSRITTADVDIVETFRELLPDGIIIGAYDGKYSYNIADARGKGGWATGGVRRLLIDAGIFGRTGPHKFIPDIYKFAGPYDRLSLLQGLMDTDGHASRQSGSASFHTSSRQLAEDVRFVVQSLGGTATWNVKPDKRGYRDQYALQIVFLDEMKPFRLSRKREKLKPRKHPMLRTIVAAELVDRRPVRCISVSNEDGLYLTDNFIVTHNSAYIEHPDLAEASLSQTTNCRIDISTPNGLGNPFHRKVTEWPADRVFQFHWRQDPRKDESWYAKQCDELDPITIAQELDIDFAASVEGVLIPTAWVQAAIDAHKVLRVNPTGIGFGALDVADEGRDTNAFCGARGILVEALEEWSGKGDDIFGTVQRAFGLCDELGYKTLRYDADGLGAGVRGDGRVINERKSDPGFRLKIEAFRGSGAVLHPEREDVKGRKNQDFFANLKAQSWWSLRTRFQKTFRAVKDGVEFDPDEIISLPRDLKLLGKLSLELSRPTYSVNTVGKIVIDKTPDGTKSPNLADALMIRFSSIQRSLVIPDAVIAASKRPQYGERAHHNFRFR